MGRVRYAFDVAQGDPQFRLNRKVVDEVADPAIELAAAGREIGNFQPEFIEAPG